MNVILRIAVTATRDLIIAELAVSPDAVKNRNRGEVFDGAVPDQPVGGESRPRGGIRSVFFPGDSHDISRRVSQIRCLSDAPPAGPDLVDGI